MDDVVIMHEDLETLRRATAEIVQFVSWLGWTVNLKKSVMEPKQVFVYLGMEWNTVEMSIRMTKKKNKVLKKELKKWTNWTRGGVTVKVRDLATIIGKLSATRAQHEEASLYLAKMNRMKSVAVHSGGWNGKVKLSQVLLADLAWWRRAIRENKPNNIMAFQPTVTVWTDASTTGWGALCTTIQGGDRMMYGWWNPKTEVANCLRKLNAVIRTIRQALVTNMIQEGVDILVRSDNTNVCFNLNKKRSGWRMRKTVKTFVQWLKERRIRIWCEHIAGEKNTIADSLSRLSHSGDYHLRRGVLQKVEELLGETVEVDLFASKENKQKAKYCTVEKDWNVNMIARDAMSIEWKGFKALVHPPIRMMVRALLKIQRDKTRAIVIVPTWKGQLCTNLLRGMLVKDVVNLGKCEDVLMMGARMRKKGGALPPGELGAYLVQG
jgi:hypothetical protein